MGYGSILLFLLIGTLLTMIVQASAATMAITLIMCANGWISYELGVALVMGENIGTTITANLAALAANTQAKRAALAHFVFNIFGVIWVLVIFHPFVHSISWFVDTYLHPGTPDVAVSYKLSAFHTTFNICNTLFLIWFVKLIERTVCWIIPQKEEEEEYRLRYIDNGMLSTAELSLLQAEQEINLYAQRTSRMLEMVKELLHVERDEEFNKLYSRIEKYESISDNMEVEIANYLYKVSEGRLSSEGKQAVSSMLRETTEIESVADSCCNLGRTLRRRREAHAKFTDEQMIHIHFMLDLVDKAMLQMLAVTGSPEGVPIDVNITYNLEREINNYRDELKTENIVDVNEKSYDYQTGVFYMDFVAECERLGDYVVNVVEAAKETKLH
jgi:phosphate:Na+ symporter